MIEIVPAYSGQALDHVIQLSREYVAWMIEQIPQHYPEFDIDTFAAEHDYDDIRKKFPGEHVPPDGALLVALSDGQACGCVALGRLDEHAAEMRTLFVRPECRGSGIGRALAQASLDEARKLGYTAVRLDTLSYMEGALSLYRSLGFSPIAPYREMPALVIRHIRFLEFML